MNLKFNNIVYSHFFHSVNQPNEQKFRNTISAGVKSISALVDMHGHSPGPASQGESYPEHLVTIIGMYNELMKQPAETSTPTVSSQNYVMQDNVVGVASPIGTSNHAPARFSTREANSHGGLNLVERFKTGRAYVENDVGGDMSPSSRKSCSKSAKTSSKKKSRKVDVRDIVANQNESRNEMRSAIINLTSSMKTKNVTIDELAFKKECWEDKKDF